MSSTAMSTVYTGFWINWSSGRVYGSTITLTAQNSAFLIAFIALWVRFVGGQLWTVITFLASITRSTAKPQDALYHQQQAILRNVSQPSNVIWGMLKLSWFWKGNTRRVWARTSAFIFAGLLYITAFAIAGVFSSRLSSADSEVLLLPSPFCGLWPAPEIGDWDPAKIDFQDYAVENTQYAENFGQLILQSHTYVSQCYNSTQNDPNQSCLPYGKSRLSWTTDSHAPCPFDDSMCITDAIRFDTGFLNSNTHFGINIKNDEIEYRRVLTCAPITTDGYEAGWFDHTELNLTEEFVQSSSPESFLTYSYGPSIFFTDNTTFAFANDTFDYSDGSYVDFHIYDLDIENYEPCTTNDTDWCVDPSFTPITPLNRSDGDVSLIFLSKNVSYLSEVQDPWFRASTYQPEVYYLNNGTAQNISLYAPDAPITVVGCVTQYQQRNPKTGATSPLGGMEFLSNSEAKRLGFNDNQMTIYWRNVYYASWLSMTNTVQALTGARLLAATYQDNSMSTALPENQWQLEFEHYFGVSLNAVQLWTQQYVSGPKSSDMNKYIELAPAGFAKDMCTKQIVRRTDHRSFSVLGLGIIFAFGFVFIIANLTIGCIAERVQKHSVDGRYRNAEWRANDFLHLQRMTYQHNNTGTWIGHNDLVPRTNPGEIFTLPESTKWNHDVPESVDKEGKGLFRSLTGASRKMSRAVPTSQGHESSAPSSVQDEKSAMSTTDVEKSGQISEKEVKR